MQDTASRVLEAINGAPHLRNSGFHRSTTAPTTPSSSRLTPGQQRWIRYLAQLRKLSGSLRRLEPLRELDAHLRALEHRYQDQRSIRDSFLASSLLVHGVAQRSDETLASVVAELLEQLDAPPRLVATSQAFAASYCGLYRLVESRGVTVHLEELVTKDRCVVCLSRPFEGLVGAIWFVRLLPNDDGTWTTLGAPYVFAAPDAGIRLYAYLARTVTPLTSASYRAFMRRGFSVEQRFNFISEAFVREDEVIYLEGIPKQPGRFRYAPSFAPLFPRRRPLARAAPVGDAYRLADRAKTHGEARSALRRWAEQSGWTRRAVRAFRTARQHLGLSDQPPRQWSKAERGVAEAYALYGHVDDQGCTAVEVALQQARAQFGPSLQAHLESIRSGWFSVFQVKDLGGGMGLGLRDVLRRRYLRVDDRSVTQQVAVGDMIAGWVTVDGQHRGAKDAPAHRLEGTFMWAPGSVALRLVKTVQYINRLFRDSLPELPMTKRLGLLAPYAALALVQLRAATFKPTIDRRATPRPPRRRRKRTPVGRQLALFDLSELDVVRPAVHQSRYAACVPAVPPAGPL